MIQLSDQSSGLPSPSLIPDSPFFDATSTDAGELIEVIQGARNGDEAAQRNLMRRYKRRVAGFVRNIIRQPDAVDDVTQMVFVKMFRRLGQLRNPRVFEAWLFILARRTSLDFIRARKCRVTTVELDDRAYQVSDPSNGEATTEILAMLERSLRLLDPKDRQLVKLVVTGERYGDIARHTGLSLAAVKVRVHRARLVLRMALGESFRPPPCHAKKPRMAPTSNRGKMTGF